MKIMDSSKSREYLMKAGIVTGACISIFLLYYYILPACGAILAFAGPILLPFILAGIVAILIDPIIDFFVLRLKIPRGWSVFAVLFIFIGGFLAILVLISSRLYVELYQLSQNVPDLRALLDELVSRAHHFYLSIALPNEVLVQLQGVAARLGASLTRGVTASFNKMMDFFAVLPGVMITLLITLIATFFFSRDKGRLQKSFLTLIPDGWQGPIKSVYLDLSLAVVGYFRAQLMLISLNTMIAIVGLYALGVEYALIMGLVTGFFDLLPIFGPGSIIVPWAIWNLVVGDIKMAVSLGVLYVIMIIVRQIMEPKLVAQNIGLHPLATLAAIFIGLKALGVVGIFLGPAVLVIFRAVAKTRAEFRR